MGLLPEGTRAWQLPGWVPSLHVRLDDGSQADLGMRLDTLAIDLDQNCLSLTWSAIFAKHSGLREIRVRMGAETPEPSRPSA